MIMTETTKTKTATTMITTTILINFAAVISVSGAHPLLFHNSSAAAAEDVPRNDLQQEERQCLALSDSAAAAADLCPGSSWVQGGGASLPNLYGHYSPEQALAELRTTLDALPAVSPSSRDLVLQFLCTLYLPPCTHGEQAPELQQPTLGSSSPPPLLPLPCRPLCEMAREQAVGRAGAGAAGVGARGQAGVYRSGGSDRGSGWPSAIRCHMFPTERCYTVAGPGEVKYVIKALVASGAGASMRDVNPQSVASLDSELGDDDTYDVQVVSLGTNQIPQRRYDLQDLGDPALFQGWADVQGTGAANDYCRVIGRGKRRFLSCALAGTRGQDHHYVSKLGFDPGHPNTWFMRDVDSDGRDDYCRCTGEKSSSHVVCMKAGEKGFYGSTIQGGSQHTFELAGRHNCHGKTLNPHFGV
ncbi:uncharacterized protein LOC143291893 [Babylonia areolata]|uniref:uncharacterized protein LOC143291893 n=1 Tax=Babylonia areolata TaxID=304850 RepID=UPI003FD4721A